MSNKKICMFALGGVILLTGCKTNENNYRAAYDAALSKRVAADADAAALSEGHAVLSIDGPSKVKAGDVEIYLERRRLKPDDAVAPPPTGRYTVAVGVFKMATNANAQVETLHESRNWKGAYVARSADGRIWSIAGAYDTLAEAAESIRRFRKDYPEYMYVGLPGEPIVVEQ